MSQVCSEKAKAGGQRLQGVNQQRSRHISSQAGPHGSFVAVLIAMGSPEMFPVEMGVRVEVEGTGLTCPKLTLAAVWRNGPSGPKQMGDRSQPQRPKPTTGEL